MITPQVDLRSPFVTTTDGRVVRLAVSLLLAVIFGGPVIVGVALLAAVGISAFDRRSWREIDPSAWLGHACEMVAAMYAGMLVYHGLAIPAVEAVIGPVPPGGLRYVGMVASMVLPMVVLMRFEGHGWRMAGEMTVAMVGPIVGCFALVGLGICPLVPFLSWLTPAAVYEAAHDGMLLGMLVLMVVRRQMYGHAAPRSHGHGLDGVAAA